MSNNFNTKETVKFLSENRKINTTEAKVRRFFTEIRKVIYLYYNIQYKSETLGEENKYENYSVDESMFCHDVNKDQLWVLGVCDNKSKDFRIVVCKNRNASTLKHFIKSIVPKGNNIICDGWKRYEWIEEANLGYVRYVHIHGRNDFGFGLESTSHIENLNLFYFILFNIIAFLIFILIYIY